MMSTYERVFNVFSWDREPLETIDGSAWSNLLVELTVLITMSILRVDAMGASPEVAWRAASPCALLIVGSMKVKISPFCTGNKVLKVLEFTLETAISVNLTVNCGF